MRSSSRPGVVGADGRGGQAARHVGGRPLLAHTLAAFAAAPRGRIGWSSSTTPERRRALEARRGRLAAGRRIVRRGRRPTTGLGSRPGSRGWTDRGPGSRWPAGRARPRRRPARRRQRPDRGRHRGDRRPRRRDPGRPGRGDGQARDRRPRRGDGRPRRRWRRPRRPRAMRRAILRAAFASRSSAGEGTWTDEAALLEACRIPVHVVPGDPENLKVTVPADLARADCALGGAGARPADRDRPRWPCVRAGRAPATRRHRDRWRAAAARTLGRRRGAPCRSPTRCSGRPGSATSAACSRPDPATPAGIASPSSWPPSTRGCATRAGGRPRWT